MSETDIVPHRGASVRKGDLPISRTAAPDPHYHDAGRMPTEALASRFRERRLRIAYDYWRRIYEEENCLGKLILTDDDFEFRPSLGTCSRTTQRLFPAIVTPAWRESSRSWRPVAFMPGWI